MVLSVFPNAANRTMCEARCDCGAVTTKKLAELRSGSAASCGRKCAAYQRERRKRRRSKRKITHRSPSILKREDTSFERFWKYTDRRGPDECWLWTGLRDKGNYGVIAVRVNGVSKSWRAHRFSWTIANGEIPSGLLVLHKCDNPICVNPAHLRVGTQLDNMRDKTEKGRGNLRSGYRHYKSKLSDQDILDIRASTESGKALAEKYKTTANYISNIRMLRVRSNAGTATSSFAKPEPPRLNEHRMAIALRAADKMARICDDMIQRGSIDARSALADARLDYGQPFKYEWSST